MKKTLSGLLALILALGLLAGCGSSDDPQDQNEDQAPSQDQADPSTPDVPAREGHIYQNLLGVDPNEAALEAEGSSIPMELYLYWLTYSCSYLESQLSMMNMYGGGAYSELINEDGSVKWDGELEGTPLSQIAWEQTDNTALSYIVMETVAAAHGVTLTDEDRAGMEKDKAAYIEQMGGQEGFENNLWEMGVSQENYDRVSAASYLYQHLLELAQDPDSDLYQAPVETDAYVDHILLMTKNSETNESLSEEEIAAKKEKAEELLAQLQEADPSGLEELFTQLAEENGEDPGRTTENGYLINADTNFVQEFKDAAFALQPGELSGIVESDYGYHILLRKELTEDQLTTIAGQHLSNYLDSRLAEMTENVKRSEKLDGIDVASFLTSYREAVMAYHPELNTENEPQEGDDAGNSEDGTSGSTDATYQPAE